MITSWLVPLVGHDFDLEDLPLWVSGINIHVVKHGNGYAIEIPVSNIVDRYENVRPLAEQQLEFINGAGRLLNSSFSPVSIGNQTLGVDSSGTILQTIICVEPAVERNKAGSLLSVNSYGGIDSDPRQRDASLFIKALLRSQKVNEVLAIMGRSFVTWPQLYIVYELIENDENVNKKFNVIVNKLNDTRDWLTGEQINRFKGTPNNYRYLGADGRHGTDSISNTKRKKNKSADDFEPMSYQEAFHFIKKLSFAWVRFLAMEK